VGVDVRLGAGVSNNGEAQGTAGGRVVRRRHYSPSITAGIARDEKRIYGECVYRDATEAERVSGPREGMADDMCRSAGSLGSV
jgi:hypothetical protein